MNIPEPIAVIGIGCRFPGGASNPDAFWNLLREGRQAVRPVPSVRWSWEHFYDPDVNRRGKCYFQRGGFLDEPIDHFDAHFFGILPVEARVIDPQIRLILEVVWEAFENAGLPPEQHRGESTGVYLSSFIPDYFLLQGQNFNAPYADSLHATGTSLAMVANRVSYTFDFRGPSIALDTACSGSHSAIYSACQEIWNGSVQLAVTGGVSLMAYPNILAPLCRSHFLSPDGTSKAFDARADGYGRGEGAGVLLLCPLSLAQQKNYPVHGLILSALANQDGRTGGIAMPSFEAQRNLIERAWQRAGIDPASARYMEAHGTGTPVGDPIEARALAETVGMKRSAGEPCFLGSTKSNIGHLEAAAGVASVIKTLLALRHRQIPPLAGFGQPNPAIPFDRYNLRLPLQLEEWPNGNGPRVSGVNGFGYGGSNCHIVLQEAPTRASTAFFAAQESDSFVLPLSARSDEALSALSGSWLAELDKGMALHDLCHSASLHRSHHSRRAAAHGSASSIRSALQALASGQESESLILQRSPKTLPRAVFVFTGMGPQTWNMGRQLLQSEESFRRTIEAIDALLKPLASWSVIEELDRPESQSNIIRPAIAQTCNFALQAALFKLLETWGIRPDAVVGHSVGEVAAAWVAGALSLEDAVTLSHHRGSLQEKTSDPGQGMLATGLAPDSASQFLQDHGYVDRVDIAALNAPMSTTLAGTVADLQQIASLLGDSGIFQRLMPTGVAYHSRDMDRIKDTLLPKLGTLAPALPFLPFYSSALGQKTGHQLLDASYWWLNVRNPVRFQSAVEALLDDGFTLFLEIGPHPVLSPSLKQIFQQREGCAAETLPTLHHKKNDRPALLETVGRLYTFGFLPEWSQINPPGSRVVLPLYPWQRERHWFETPGLKRWTHPDYAHPLLGQKENLPTPAWSSEPGFHLHPWLQDHRIDGQAVFPSAAWLEMALAAAREQAIVPGSSLSLEKIVFSEALVLDDGPYPKLLFQIARDDSFEVLSQRSSEEPVSRWISHVQGHLLPSGSHRPEHTPEPSLTWEECTQHHSQHCDSAAFHESVGRFGLDYGPGFQSGQGMRWQGLEGSARLGTSPGPAGQGRSWLCHPCLLDRALQTLLFLMARQGIPGGRWLPVSVEKVVFFEEPGPGCHVHSRLTQTGPDHCKGDLALYRNDGRLALRVTGIGIRHLHRTNQSAGPRMECAYDEAWIEHQPGPATALSGTWHLSGDPSETWCSRLQQRLAKSPLSLVANPAEHPSTPLTHAVYLGSLAAGTDSGSHAEAIADQGLALLDFIKNILPGATPDKPVRVLVLTRGALRVQAEDPSPRLLAGSLWGSFRCLMKERTDLDFLALDLPADGNDPSPDRLLDLFLSQPLPKETAWRKERLLVRQIRRLDPDEPCVKEAWHGTPPLDTPSSAVLDSDQPGSLRQLRFRRQFRRTPEAGEVEIQIQATALNFKDVLKASGLADPKLLSDSLSGRRLGLECSGSVLRCGAGTTLKPGDQVLAWAAYGSFATHLTLPERFCIPRPSGVSSDIGGAQIPLLTAWHALHGLARLQPGETVLIHSAAGGVGHYAVEIAKDIGAKTIATAGSEEKRQLLREQGIPCVCDSRSLDFAEEILLYTAGRGVDVVLNSLPGRALSESLRLLAPFGRFVEIGKRDILEDNPVGLGGFHRNTSFFSIDYDQGNDAFFAASREYLRQAWAKIGEGRIQLPPMKVFPASQAADAFQFMAESRHIGRVSLRMQNETLTLWPKKHPAPLFRSDRSYWITGGLGEVGFQFARWILRHGGGCIILSGRSQPDPERLAELQALQSEIRDQKSEITFLPCDIGSLEDCRALLDRIASGHPPLAGIIHAAGVVEDTFIHDMDRKKFLDPLRSKVAGTWNLHTLTKDLPLDHFILASSIASGWGSPGQTNYAAANAFMDALAEQRQLEGLPAVSIHFGALAGKRSMAERFHPHAEKFFRSIGLPLLPVGDALEVLEQLLLRGRSRFTLADVEWPAWMKSYPQPGESLRFGKLAEESAAAEKDAITGATFSSRMQQATTEEQAMLILLRLREIIAGETRLPLDKVDPDLGLREIGIDSLSSVAIDIRIRESFGVTIPFLQLFQEPHLKSIANKIQQRL